MSDVGAVIVANDTERFSYTKLAHIAAEKIKRHLKIPTTILNVSAEHNQRYIRMGKTDWQNMGRTQVYELSPYDRTVLIDADMFINTDALSNHIFSNIDFSIARQMYDPTTGSTYVQKLGKTQIDQTWATLVIFNKCQTSKNIFELAQHVLNHYQYYALLYNFKEFPLRNDYAFSIACHLMGGYGQGKFDIESYSLTNCDFNTIVRQVNDNDVVITYNKNRKDYIVRIKSDVHLQEKVSLFEAINE